MGCQRSLAALALLSVWACRDPETQARQDRLERERTQIAAGRSRLAQGDAKGAVPPLEQACATAPEDPQPLLLLAQAHQGLGNATAAILELKQAAEMMKGGAPPELQRQLAALYQVAGAREEAVVVLTGLRDANQLSDAELLALARLQGQLGQRDDAFKTLSWIQGKRPDDPEAKVVEAEVLLSCDKELLAAKIMDRLLERNPGQVSARLLRARYFLRNGYPDLAEQDLEQIHDPGARKEEVATSRAQALAELKRYAEAEAVLRPVLEADPRNADVLAQRAELQLYLGKVSEAQALIDQALAIRPNGARALYVRGRVLESQGELDQATEVYGYALKADPGFPPVLSRVWRIESGRGEKTEAMSTLERLLSTNEATLDEKAALAELYAAAGLNVERGRALIAEVLRRDPDNAHYREIQKALGKAPALRPRPSRPTIIRIGRH